MKLHNFILPSLALGTAALLIVPGEQVQGFTTIGGSLPAESQRDFRVRNNFVDSQTNNNTTADANYPGWTGAFMAIWKGATEWGSGAHGDGSGDPTQSTLGSGGANFDFAWMGETSGVGGTNDNISSALGSCGGNTLAFVETPISTGWRMRFCDNWTWSDGPGNPPGGQFDLQGVATHEFGHSLGLGHSFSGTVMQPSTFNGADTRALSSDDIAGVQFIYGVKSSTKPDITAAVVDGSGANVTITGTDFSTTNNEVWFTNSTITSTGGDPRVIVTGVASSGGGTSITVAIPTDAGAGDIFVKQNATGNSTLSDGFPVDLSGPPPPPDPVAITSVSPSIIDSLIPGTDETITITGTGFTANTVIEVDGIPIATSFTLVSDTSMTFDFPPVSVVGGLRFVGVDDPNGTDVELVSIVSPSTPTLQVGSGDPGNVVLSASGVDVVFAGQPGAIHDLVASASNVPSVLPGKINLDLGNSFSQFTDLGFWILDGEGLASANIPLLPTAGATVYFQSVELSFPIPAGFPWAESNLQSILILF